MIYICIPAHNEEQTAGVVLWKIRQVMAEFPRDYQILVADDASTDKTYEVLSPYTRVLPLTVVRSDTRRGYAASLEMLLREAVRRSEYPKRDFVITIQADFSQEPEDIIPMIKAMEAGADIVCGESATPADASWKLRWSRRLAGRVLKRKSVPEGVTDPFTGFRAYRIFTIKKAIESRGGNRLLVHDSWAANAELLAATAAHARRVDPLDVTVRPHRLQRPSRLHPWPALMNVWAYARRAKPTIDVASVSELDESVASTAVNRKNDVASVRERISERSDMHGNRSAHGDRHPHNARSESPRGRGGRDRDRARSPDGERNRGDGERNRNGERARTGGRPQQPRAAADRTNGERANGERTQRERPSRNERPRREQVATDSGEARTRQPRGGRNGDRAKRAVEEVAANASIEETPIPADAAIPIADGDAAPKKKRRRRSRRSRSGGEGTATNVSAADELSGEPSESDGADDVGGDTSDDATDGSAVPASEGAPRKRRRGRRGGRGRRRQGAAGAAGAASSEDASTIDMSGGDTAVMTEPAPRDIVAENITHSQPERADYSGDA